RGVAGVFNGDGDGDRLPGGHLGSRCVTGRLVVDLHTGDGHVHLPGGAGGGDLVEAGGRSGRGLVVRAGNRDGQLHLVVAGGTGGIGQLAGGGLPGGQTRLGAGQGT